MNAKDLKTKANAELNEQLLELKREQFKLRMQRGQGQLTKTHQFREARKNVARIKTVLTQKAAAEAK
jgi:large subunit ribosomal protein L29